MARVLITGAAGFVGSHLVKAFCDRGDEVVALDSLTYAGDLGRVDPRAKFVCFDFYRPRYDGSLEGADYIVHNGAESHVTRSLSRPDSFVSSNIIGTLNMLEIATIFKPKKFVYTSTDEVFGSRTTPARADERLEPSSPYSATKAGGEYLVNSYRRCFGVPAVITRTSNLFGPGQDEEKFVPLVIGKLLRGETVPIHTTKDGKIGSRRWLPVKRQVDAAIRACECPETGQVIHVGGGIYLDNRAMAECIAGALGMHGKLKLVSSDRPAYDESYSLDSPDPSVTESEFASALTETVNFYKQKMTGVARPAGA